MEFAVIAVLFFLAYFLPTLCAHPSRRDSVLLVNFFFGWTLLGWFIALIMAVRSRESARGAV